mmetsp:Transcript_37803/g.99989  ORF Transcript_37803/g.99989 Transcript_37803/m.99989 type:complete len:83 (-) Transcript_37803:1044-1292(-)
MCDALCATLSLSGLGSAPHLRRTGFDAGRIASIRRRSARSGAARALLARTGSPAPCAECTCQCHVQDRCVQRYSLTATRHHL